MRDDHDRMMICSFFYAEWKEFKSCERKVQKAKGIQSEFRGIWLNNCQWSLGI